MRSASEGFDMIECPRVDRDAQDMDTSGYWFLIRPNFEQGFIEAAACHKDSARPKNIVEIYYGTSAQDIYCEILKSVMPRSVPDKPYVRDFTHAAYLGKELKKAELALAIGIRDHYQE